MHAGVRPEPRTACAESLCADAAAVSVASVPSPQTSDEEGRVVGTAHGDLCMAAAAAAAAERGGPDDELIPAAVIWCWLEALRSGLAAMPDLRYHSVYEAAGWIHYPVQVMLSRLHGRRNDAFGGDAQQLYLSTRSIGEFALHLLNARVALKANITTAIVRQFRALDPDLYKYGLLVKRLGQKQSRAYRVTLIPSAPSAAEAGAACGRGSHRNSRGTSYFWPLPYVARVVNPFLRIVHCSRAFRDLQLLGPPRSACGPAGSITISARAASSTTDSDDDAATGRGPDLSPPTTPDRSASDRKRARDLVHVARRSAVRAAPSAKRRPHAAPAYADPVPQRGSSTDEADEADLEEGGAADEHAVPQPERRLLQQRQRPPEQADTRPAGPWRSLQSGALPSAHREAQRGPPAAPPPPRPGHGATSATASGPDAEQHSLAGSIAAKRRLIEDLHQRLVGLIFEVAQEELALRAQFGSGGTAGSAT